MIGYKVFANRKAENLFLELYDTLNVRAKQKFSRSIHRLFDERIVGDGDKFYLDEGDVAACYDSLTK